MSVREYRIALGPFPPIERIVSAEEGRVACSHRKVAIVGAAPGRERAPYDNPEWCVYALNEIAQRSFTRHFELHPLTQPPQSDRELAWLRTCPTPCYVLDLEEARRVGVANAVQFPRDRILAAGFREYWTCTFGMQLALALLEGAEEIGLWGVTLYGGTARERTAERACVEYWIGVAEGLGVKIVEDSGLCRSVNGLQYGYDYDKELRAVQYEMDRLATVLRREATERQLEVREEDIGR